LPSGKHKLTARKVATAKGPCRLSDGHGLYFVIRKGGGSSWSYVWIRNGIRREIGLGGLANVSLAEARTKAERVRQQIGSGLDPFVERDKAATKTFGEVADMVIEELRPSWTNKKHGWQWVDALETKCASIRSTPVNEIETAHVLKVLKPVWKKTPETGRRLRSRIERVIDYAHAHGWRTGENPARWRGHLENILIMKKREATKHLPAMPYAEVPAFMAELKEKDSVSARALEFTILTAARTSETLKALWSEFDLEDGLWTVPAERMKMRVEHKVPLTEPVVDLLKALYELRMSDFVFPGGRPHRPLSDMSMTMVVRRMGQGDFTVHGFRSSFRDFAGDETMIAREVAEAALAHRVGNAIEAAYRRGDALEKRRGLMQLWADHCVGGQSKNVVRLRG